MIPFIYAHLIGDYLIQTDWMAAGKKKAGWICLVHVLTYLIPFLFVGWTWQQLALVGIEHYIQDRTNIVSWFMRAKGSAKFMEPPLGPWSIIVTDNVLHILFMGWVATL